MKIDRRRAYVLLALVSSVVSVGAADLEPRAADSNVNYAGDKPALEPETPYFRAKGTEHAPVDGRDGMPHEGPFVETSAERERKKQGAAAADDDGDDRPPQAALKDKYADSDLPESHDGVMDDRKNSKPVEGSRGTEGGISEKSKSKDTTAVEKKPDAPKEVKPMPHSESAIPKGTADDAKPVEPEEPAKPILTAPTDLPDKPHDIPHPENPSSPKDHDIFKDPAAPSSTPDHEPAVISPMHSLVLSFTMILVSEIGDKTFLVACLMAMRHPRLQVFTAAFSALITMTVLSAVLGHAVPTLIPKTVTNFAAAGLFLIFGVRMLVEARSMTGDEGVSEEMREVEMELEEKEHAQRRMSRRRASDISPYTLEAGRPGRKSNAGRLPSPPESPGSSRDPSPERGSALKNALAGLHNLFSLLLSPAWVQTFVMTFLGEWGDRSQIATIAMAAGQDYWWVTAGALGGHAICTGAAVLGGRAIAGRVSLRTVTMGGAIAFLVFGGIYLLEAVY